jgi:vitamin B12 transporter
MKKYVFCATALLSISAPVMASDEGPGDGETILIADLKKPDIIVTANRDERTADTVGESVTVIDPATIDARQSVDALPLLSSTPGVSFARNGGIGAASSVYIRGAEGDQTVVLFDGVKLTDPASPGGGFNFGPLMTGEVGTIEVQRGAASVLYGSQAIGGVVHFISRDIYNPEIRARAEYGSRDSVLASGGVAGTFGPLALTTGVTYVRTDGISAFDAGTEADGFESIGGQLSARLTLSNALSIDVRGLYADSTAAYDGYPAPNYVYADAPLFGDRTDYLGYAGVNLSFFDGAFTNRLGVAATRIDRTDEDRSGATPFVTFDATGKTTRLEYQGGYDAGIAQITFGAEREESSYRTDGYGTVETADASVNSGYAQVSVTPVRGLTITGGVRHDDHKAFGGHTVFAGSIAYSPNYGQTQLRASFGEGFKAPSLFQLYSQYGNETLSPETSQSWDAGVTQRFLGGAAEVSATYFRRDSKNLIAYVGCFLDPNPICVGRPFGTYDNIAKASAKGVEIGLTLRPAEGFTVSANYTHTNARDEVTGNRLARRPADVVNLNADYVLPFGLSLGAGIQVSGDRFDNARNTRRLDGYILTDVRASLPISEGIEVYGRVENLFDVDYATVYQNGQAGRGVFGGVRIKM